MKQKLNPVQQMLADTDMLAYGLPVQHDTEERQVVINGVRCTYCRTKQDKADMHFIQDVAMCESCYEGMVE